MALSMWPYVGQKTKETEWRGIIGPGAVTGVVGTPGDTTLKVTADATGMRVRVAPGPGVVDSFGVQATATETVAIAAADSLRRIDLVVARAHTTGTAEPRGELLAIKGTPGAGKAPANAWRTGAAGDSDLVLAEVTVDPGVVTIQPSAVKDRRVWVTRGGGSWDANAQPANPGVDDFGFNRSAGYLERYTPTGFVPIPPPQHDASLIATGVLHPDRIPGLDVAKISTGVLGVDRGGTGVTGYEALRGKIGAAAASHVHTAAQIDSGRLSMDRLPMWTAIRELTFAQNGFFDFVFDPGFPIGWAHVELGPGNGEHVYQNAFLTPELIQPGFVRISVRHRNAGGVRITGGYNCVTSILLTA